jgi:hypothetical protein
MADSYGAVTVDTSADQIIAQSTVRRTVLIYNNGTAVVYIGFDVVRHLVQWHSSFASSKHGNRR